MWKNWKPERNPLSPLPPGLYLDISPWQRNFGPKKRLANCKHQEWKNEVNKKGPFSTILDYLWLQRALFCKLNRLTRLLTHWLPSLLTMWPLLSSDFLNISFLAQFYVCFSASVGLWLKVVFINFRICHSKIKTNLNKNSCIDNPIIKIAFNQDIQKNLIEECSMFYKWIWINGSLDGVKNRAPFSGRKALETNLLYYNRTLGHNNRQRRAVVIPSLKSDSLQHDAKQWNCRYTQHSLDISHNKYW